MNPFFFYLLKVSICSGVLFGYYWLALRNKLFHQWNRFYLLVAVVLSLLVPLVHFRIAVKDESNVLNILYSANSENVFIVRANAISAGTISPEQGLQLGYGIVCLLLFSTAVSFLFKLFKIIHSHHLQRINTIHFINTEEAGTPFSFFNYIIWNKNISLESVSGRQIFNHELTHVKEGHSYDKVFCLLVLIPFWANPFFWFIRKELNAIHEFIADQKSVGAADTEAFSKMILQITYPNKLQLFGNPFFQSSIKRRLIMLSKNKNPKVNYLGRILMLPVAALLILGFSVKVESRLHQNERSVSTVDTISAKNVPLTLLPAHKIVKNGVENFINAVLDTTPTLKYKGRLVKDVVMVKGETKTEVFLTYEDGTKETITENEARKANLLTKTTTRFTPPVIKKDTIVLKSTKGIFVKSVTTQDATKYKNLLILLDGNIFSRPFSQLPQNNISSISLIEGEDLIKEYGAKASNGVLSVFTKEYAKSLEAEREKNPPIFTQVEVEPIFNGNWADFLRKNLNPDIPAMNNAPAGKYNVMLQFTVDKNGAISDIKPVTSFGYGMEDEVVRIMKISPPWRPGMQNGRNVSAYRKQPITFVVPDEKADTTVPKVPTIKLKDVQNVQLCGSVNGYELKSFTVFVDDKKGGVLEHANEGLTFDAKTKGMISTLKPGDYISFEKIRGLKNGEEKKFPAKFFKVE